MGMNPSGFDRAQPRMALGQTQPAKQIDIVHLAGYLDRLRWEEVAVLQPPKMGVNSRNTASDLVFGLVLGRGRSLRRPFFV
jgi:hypothetical protein